MRSYRRRLWVGIGTVLLTLALRTPGWGQAAFYTVGSAGPGVFQYSLLLDNTGGPGPISGLLVLNGNSVFGLGPGAPIQAPQDIGGNAAADWGFFEPFPPFADALDYFSLSPLGDVPVGGTLGGFSFVSATDPGLLTGGAFQLNLVTGGGTVQIPVVATPLQIPEASTLLLMALGLAGNRLAARRKRVNCINFKE